MLTSPTPFDEAIDKIQGKTPVAADLSSSEWQKVPAALRERAFFSAHCTSALFLQQAQDLITGFLAKSKVEITKEDGSKVTALKAGSRGDLVKQAKEAFGGQADAGGGSVKDLTSTTRLELIFTTQTRQAYGFGWYKQGLDQAVLDAFPAQRFVRGGYVQTPRPDHVEHQGEVRLKSDINYWLARNDPTFGGFGVPWGPWGYNSQMDVEDVSRVDAIAMGLLKPGEKIKVKDVDFNENLKASVQGLSPEILNQLEARLGGLATVEGDSIHWTGDEISKAYATKPKPPPPPPAPVPPVIAPPQLPAEPPEGAFETILAAAKTLSVHAQDKKFNQATLDAFEALGEQLVAWDKAGAKAPWLDHYLSAMSKIQSHAWKGEPIPVGTVTKWQPTIAQTEPIVAPKAPIVAPEPPIVAPTVPEIPAYPVPPKLAYSVQDLPELSVEGHDLHAELPGWQLTKTQQKKWRSVSYGGVIFDEHGRILLRQPTGYFDGYVWTFPKGRPDYKGEDPLKAAQREIAEESGHKAAAVGILGGKGYKGGGSTTFFFVMRSSGVDPKIMDSETAQTRWATLEEAKALINQTTNKIGRKRDLKVLEDAYAAHQALLAGKSYTWPEKPTPAPEPEPVGEPSPKFPANPEQLTTVKTLGGSTGATLVEDPADGWRYVLKKGNSPEHVREEVEADNLYRFLGANVPAAKLYNPGTPDATKLASFIEGKTWGEWSKTASKAELDAASAQVRRHFVVDALLGNWDVAGMGMDNLLVDAGGKVWRIDNGGSLRFRAQGGKKSADDWGPTVKELSTMRDPNVNPSAAKLFKGLTNEEIALQIRDLVDKRSALLEFARPQHRDTLASRIDYLENLLPSLEADLPRTPPPPKEPRPQLEPRKRGTLTSEAFTSKAKNARVLGLQHTGDKDAIEDLAVLVYQEKDARGQDVTVARFKLTPTGGRKVREASPNIAKAVTKAAAVAPEKQVDEFWPKILMAAKTVAAHAADGKYNPNTMATLAQVKSILQAKVPGDGQAVHYLAAIAKIEEAKAANVAPATLSPYVPPAKAAKAEEPTRDAWHWAQERWQFKVNQLQRGHAVETENANRFAADNAIAGSHTNGARINLVMPDTGGRMALRGLAEIRVAGSPTAETMAKIHQAARDMGVDIDDASDDRRELVYLARGLRVLEKKVGADWKEIVGDETKTERERVLALKDWVRGRLKIDLNKSPDYRPQEVKTNAWGYGYATQDRWDMPRTKVEKEMAGYSLYHSSSTNLPQLVDALLQNGAQFTPTVERLRAGVPVTSGMSPDADLDTGGASYLFTRIKDEQSGNGFYFKIGNLARMDAWSFPGDRFGDIREPGDGGGSRSSPTASRGITVEDWKKYSRSGSNETIFKNGFNLLDEVDTIKTGSQSERQQVLAAFRRHGYTTLPDGRSIEEIVK